MVLHHTSGMDSGPRSRLSRRAALAVLALVGLLGTVVFGATPAHAAPVYEIVGDWEEGTANPVAKGDVVTAIWHVNVNDSDPASGNEPVENMNFSVTLGHGLFKSIPDVCLTTGVDPVSSLSEDGRTLLCNLGTVAQGTAYAVQTPVVADGLTGDQITATGTIAGLTDELDPIDIVNTFGMDILWETPTNTLIPAPGGNGGDIAFDFEWTLFQDRGSDPGPNEVVYNLNISLQNGQPLVVSRQSNTAPLDQPCAPFQQSGVATGHPYSGGGQPDQRAPFVESCLLEHVAGNNFRLTLTGIDYSLVQVPTRDSAGNPMPVDRVAVASGSIWLRVNNLTSGTNADLTATMVGEYESTTGISDPDEQANNTSSKVITFPGTWTHRWIRPFGGTPWDYTFKMFPGATVTSATSDTIASNQSLPANAVIADCTVLDSAYVDYQDVTILAWEPGDPALPADPQFGTFQWYTGNDPLVTPGSGQYNPDAWEGCAGGAGWVNTEPVGAGLLNVKAVRWVSNAGVVAGRNLQLRVDHTIQENAPIGQDIWTWASFVRDNQWLHPGRGDTPGGTPTPGSRYPSARNGRDVVRVVFAVPDIVKTGDRQVVRPGEPATFTLGYSANGSGSIPPTVDDFQIVDTLPVGMTYVEDSATPAPDVTFVAGQQVLTWELDGVPTNNPDLTLTYQAVAEDSVTPGQTLTNTAVATLRGESAESTEQVTVSTSGSTSILKTSDVTYIPNPDGSGNGTGSWTVTIQSNDPLPQEFTDTIDILPWIGDQRGTSFNGTYALDEVVLLDGGTVYYTDAAPATLSDDPDADANGDPNAPSALWSTTRPANVTAIRVIGGELLPGASFSFQVVINTVGAQPQDVYVNRAQARAEHTALVMRTSAALIVAHQYDYELKKYVQDTNGVWHDAQEPIDYPSFDIGDTITYRIQVTNTGQGTLEDLVIDDDVFDQGSFTIDTLPAVEPGNVVTHEFSVVADASMIGTLVNTACATVTTTPPDAPAPEDKCDPAGVLVFDTDFDKVLIGKVPNGDGTYTITYDVIVTRVGEGPGYDLIDTLRYGASASIVSTAVTNTAPGGIATNPAWNGTSDVAVASAIPIADGESHTYQMAVVASIDEPATTAAMSDCDLGGDAGTGFHNTAQLTTGTRVFVDDACVEYPAPVIAKSVASGPTDLGDGRYQVTYDITATNNGVDPTTYDLDDTLKYGNGISIVSTTVSNSSPGGIATSGSWNGTSDIRVATGVPIGGVTVHTYTAAVTFTVAGGITAEALNCTFAGGEAGTGLFNTATLTNNGETRTADACAVPPQPAPPSPPVTPPPTPQDPGQLPATGGNGTPIVNIGLLLLALGGVAVTATRRFRRPKPMTA